jgi:hypothetical protein
MVTMNRLCAPAIFLLVGGILVGGCTTNTAIPNGLCAQDPGVEATCTAGRDGGSAQSLGLTGYQCSGTARPDQTPTYIQGVPQGLVCANQTKPGADGGTPGAYCCTSETTNCAFNPIAICDPGTYGYKCQGANRPEAYNPELACGQGVVDGTLIDYCCSGTGLPQGCTELDTAPCAGSLVGWGCPASSGVLPKGQDLAMSKSRADQYYLLCAVPNLIGPNNIFCCYPPAVVPPGGSCVQDTTVPGCAPGRFGFACYGPDQPQQDFPPMRCPDPGVPGTSYQGYPATLYCCDFAPEADGGV